jgi:exonuclease III
MILLSLNIRGVGGPLKTTSLRRLLNKTHLDIIFVQETLVDELRTISFLTSLRPDWYTCAVSSVGKSGGLLVSWDPYKFDLTSYICCGGLLFTGTSLDLKKHISFLNLYGPVLTERLYGKKCWIGGYFILKI